MKTKQLQEALERLYNAVPAIGHHDIPTYDCPMRELAKAMNEAALLLGKREPYKIP